jgi:tetratricopeptide (TPR) repeat protein
MNIRRIHMLWVTTLFITIVGCVFLVAALLFLRWHKNTKDSIEAAEENWRQAGLPETLKQLNEWYEAVPDDENMALVLHEAFALLNEADPENTLYTQVSDALKSREPGMPVDPQLMVDAQAYVQQIEPVLALLEKAATKPASRYPVDLNTEAFQECPHLKLSRGCVRALSIGTQVAAYQGRNEDAIEYFRIALDISESLSEEPMLISQLVRMQSVELSVWTLEEILDYAQFSEQNLLVLKTLFSGRENPESAFRGFVGDHLIMMDNFEQIFYGRKYPNSSDGELRKRGFLKRLPLIRNYYALHEKEAILQFFDTLLQVRGQPWPEWVSAQSFISEQNKRFGKTRVLYRVFVPGPRSITFFVREAASLRLAQQVIDIELYALHIGKLPETLEALSEPIREDPFSGQPLRYKLLDDGYMVYSVYTNGKDDDGREPGIINEKKVYYDWVFRVYRKTTVDLKI